MIKFKCCNHCANFRELIGDIHLDGFCRKRYSPHNVQCYETNLITFANVVSCEYFEPIFEQEINELTKEFQCR